MSAPQWALDRAMILTLKYASQDIAKLDLTQVVAMAFAHYIAEREGAPVDAVSEAADSYITEHIMEAEPDSLDGQRTAFIAGAKWAEDQSE